MKKMSDKHSCRIMIIVDRAADQSNRIIGGLRSVAFDHVGKGRRVMKSGNIALFSSLQHISLAMVWAKGWWWWRHLTYREPNSICRTKGNAVWQQPGCPSSAMKIEERTCYILLEGLFFKLLFWVVSGYFLWSCYVWRKSHGKQKYIR